MDDTLKDAATALLGLLVFTGFIHYRAERAIIRDVSRTAQGGTVGARVNGRGLLGLAVGQADTVFVTGRGFKSEGFPFVVRRGDGFRAYVRRLNIDFAEFTLRGVPVRRFVAEFPGTTIDAGRAFFDERIVMRAAKDGTADAVVGPEGLAALFAKKYPQYRNVRFTIRPGFVDVSADVPALGPPLRMESSSRVELSEGRYVILGETTMRLNGKAPTRQFVQNTLTAVNPVVDLDKDLGLGAYFTAREVVVGEGFLTVRGVVTVLRADDGPRNYEKQEKKP